MYLSSVNVFNIFRNLQTARKYMWKEIKNQCNQKTCFTAKYLLLGFSLLRNTGVLLVCCFGFSQSNRKKYIQLHLLRLRKITHTTNPLVAYNTWYSSASKASIKPEKNACLYLQDKPNLSCFLHSLPQVENATLRIFHESHQTHAKDFYTSLKLYYLVHCIKAPEQHYLQ